MKSTRTRSKAKLRAKRDACTHAALVKAVRSLKPKPSRGKAYRYATRLRLVADFAALLTLPMSRRVNPTAAQRELQQAIRKADAFAKALHALSRSAHDAYKTVWISRRNSMGELPQSTPEHPVPAYADPVMLMDAVLEFAEAASLARERDTAEHVSSTRKPQTAQVTRSAVLIYSEVTGQRPTRRTNPYSEGNPYGPLHSFLSDVFKALKLTASADAQLKRHLTLLKKTEDLAPPPL